MKRILCAAASLALGACLCACGKGDKSSWVPSRFEGKWQLTETVNDENVQQDYNGIPMNETQQIELKTNGVCVIGSAFDDPSEYETCTWKEISDTEIEIKTADGTMILQERNGSLILKEDDDAYSIIEPVTEFATASPEDIDKYNDLFNFNDIHVEYSSTPIDLQ